MHLPPRHHPPKPPQNHAQTPARPQFHPRHRATKWPIFFLTDSEVGHSDKSVNDRYTHPLEEAHLAAAEQVAALIRKAGASHDAH